MSKGLLLLLISPALIVAGCGPDAPRDNPYDVPQTGVYGTTYRRSGGPLPGVAVSASPANITASSDGQGNYSLELTPGSRQVLQFTKTGRQTVADTVDVPERGLVRHNVIMRGQLLADTLQVRTVLVRRESGSLYYSLQPYAVIHHPDGRGYLDSFDYVWRIDGHDFSPAAPVRRDDSTNLYLWTVDTIPGVSGFGAYVVGRVTQFLVSSAGYSLLVNRMVPPFLEPAPDNLAPSSWAPFSPPDTLRWATGRSDVDITVEVYQGTGKVWSKDTTNISKVLLPGPLPAGNYAWKVIARDISGNRAQAEATFTRP
jgi:hypothetical protein